MERRDNFLERLQTTSAARGLGIIRHACLNGKPLFSDTFFQDAVRTVLRIDVQHEKENDILELFYTKVNPMNASPCISILDQTIEN